MNIKYCTIMNYSKLLLLILLISDYYYLLLCTNLCTNEIYVFLIGAPNKYFKSFLFYQKQRPFVETLFLAF